MKKTLKSANLISGGASTCCRVLEEEKPGGIIFGASETVVVIADSTEIAGIKNVQAVGFPEKHIQIVEQGPDFAIRIMKVFHRYKIDYFHQLGWMPHTPKDVTSRYMGLNQHLGPGGQGMFGKRRVYAHMRFCQEVGRIIPIQVFCQLVDPIYDAGKVVAGDVVDLDFKKTPEKNVKLLLPIEHEIQILGRQLMFYGFNQSQAHKPINIAQNPQEEKILAAMKEEAIRKYPRKK